MNPARSCSGFSEQQALAAYHKRGDTVVIRIRLVLPAAYPEKERGAQAPAVSHDPNQTANLRPENFWQKFQFAAQTERQDHPHKVDPQSAGLFRGHQEILLLHSTARPSGSNTTPKISPTIRFQSK